MMKCVSRGLVALWLCLAPAVASAQTDIVARGLAASALPVKAVPSLADLGAPSSQPFVIVCAGQSNMSAGDPGGNYDSAGNLTAAFQGSVSSGVLSVTAMLTDGNVYNFNVATATGTPVALADNSDDTTPGTLVSSQITSTYQTGTITASIPANSNQMTISGSASGAAAAVGQLVFGGILPPDTYIQAPNGTNVWTLSKSIGPTAITNGSLNVGTPGNTGTYQTNGNQTFTPARNYLATGTKTINQTGGGIWMTGGTGTVWTNPTGIVRAAFGTAPLNTTPYGYSDQASLSGNNMCVAMANELRAKSSIQASRPIVLLMDCHGGESISAWVDGSPINLGPLTIGATPGLLAQEIALVTAQYGPGWSINAVMWAQSGQDGPPVSFPGYIGPNSQTLTLTGQAGVGFNVGNTINPQTGTGLQDDTIIVSLLSGTLGATGSTYSTSNPNNANQTVGSSGSPVTFTTGSIYGSESLYAGAYARLQTDFQNLTTTYNGQSYPVWTINTRVLDMMEPVWYDAGASIRDDFKRTLTGGAIYPYIDTVSSSGLAGFGESLIVPGPHFSGHGNMVLGQRAAHAYLASAGNSNFKGMTYSSGTGQSFWNQLTPGSGSKIGVEDILSGAVMATQGGSIYLTDPKYVWSPFLAICDTTSNFYAPVSTNSAPFRTQINGFDYNPADPGLTSVQCSLGQTLLFVPNGGSYYVYPIGFQVGTTVDNVLLMQNSGTATNVGSSQLRGAVVPTLATPISFQPPLGSTLMVTNDPTANGPSSITINGGNVLQGPDGQLYNAANPYYVYPGDVVTLEAGYDANLNTKYWIKNDVQWSGRAAQKTTQQTGSGSASSIANVGGAVAVGSIASNQLTLTSITSGTFYPGTKISGSGFSADYIINQVTSTANNGTASCTIPANSNVMTCGTVTGTAIAIGDLASGTGLPAGDYVQSGSGPWTMSQYVTLPVNTTVTFGTANGAGIYTLATNEAAGVPPGTTINGQTGELTIGGTITGTFSVGNILSGGTTPAADFITYPISGSGGAGSVYAVSQITAVSSAAITATAYLQCLSGYGSLYVADIPGATVSAETKAFPLTPKGGQSVDFYFANAVTALTFSPAATTFTNGSGVTAGTKLSFKFDPVTGAWE